MQVHTSYRHGQTINYYVYLVEWLALLNLSCGSSLVSQGYLHSSWARSELKSFSGTSAGFGSILTKTVLSRGDRVIASARSLDKIKHLESENCKTLQLDVTDSEEIIKQKGKQAVDIWGRVDVVVNNAGVGAPGIAEEVGYVLILSMTN